MAASEDCLIFLAAEKQKMTLCRLTWTLTPSAAVGRGQSLLTLEKEANDQVVWLRNTAQCSQQGQSKK